MRQAAWSTPTIPVGPSYRDALSPSSSTSAGSVAEPVTGHGRVWGTSASSAPSVTTIWTSRLRASSTISPVNVRQRVFGSIPIRMIASRGSAPAAGDIDAS